MRETRCDTGTSMLISEFPVVVFDLFHTLTSLEAVKAPGHNTSVVLGITRDQWFRQLFEHSSDRLTGKVKDPHEIIERLAHAVDPGITSKIIAQAVENRMSRFNYALLHPDKDTLDTLQTLKDQKKKIGLVSNADVMEKAAWTESPLARFFDCAIFSCDVGVMKPDHAIYRICLDRLEATPAGCLYAGDGSHDELKGAQEVGLTTVLVTHVLKKMWPERILPARSYANYEIEKLSALLKLTRDHDLLR